MMEIFPGMGVVINFKLWIEIESGRWFIEITRRRVKRIRGAVFIKRRWPFSAKDLPWGTFVSSR